MSKIPDTKRTHFIKAALKALLAVFSVVM